MLAGILAPEGFLQGRNTSEQCFHSARLLLRGMLRLNGRTLGCRANYNGLPATEMRDSS